MFKTYAERDSKVCHMITDVFENVPEERVESHLQFVMQGKMQTPDRVNLVEAIKLLYQEIEET